MKKSILFLTLTFISFIAFAQSVSLGIKGGINFATLQSSTSSSSSTETTGSFTSFSAGAFADLGFGNLSLQPALLLTGKGGQDNSTLSIGETTINIKEKVSLLYLQLPVDVVYHVPIVVGNIYFGAGPYAAMGLSGKIKGSISTVSSSDPSQNQNSTVDRNVKFGSNSDSDFSSGDFGLNILAGVKFKSGFLASINYDWGLSNILSKANRGDDNRSIKTRVAGLSVGYAFK